MKDNGLQVPKLDKDEVHKSGLTDPCMKAIGRITKQQEEEERYMQTERFMMALGRTIKLMVKEF